VISPAPTGDIKFGQTAGYGHFYTRSSLDAFAKLRKANINHVTSVRLSVHMEITRTPPPLPPPPPPPPPPHWTDFHKTWYLNICRKSGEKIQDSQKI